VISGIQIAVTIVALFAPWIAARAVYKKLEPELRLLHLQGEQLEAEERERRKTKTLGVTAHIWQMPYDTGCDSYNTADQYFRIMMSELLPQCDHAEKALVVEVRNTGEAPVAQVLVSAGSRNAESSLRGPDYDELRNSACDPRVSDVRIPPLGKVAFAFESLEAHRDAEQVAVHFTDESGYRWTKDLHGVVAQEHSTAAERSPWHKRMIPRVTWDR